MSPTSSDSLPWPEVNPLLFKVHVDCRVHATYTEIQLLIQRNGLWSERIAHYVADTLAKWKGYRLTAPPVEPGKGSLTSMSHNCNEIVSIYHCYLYDM